MYLAITGLATIMLYYELYVGGSVSTLILPSLHMSFTFFVYTLAIGNLIGAFGSLFAGITDRLGRANLVVFGLFFTGIFVAFVLPAATSKWVFTIEGFVVGVVEGICLVATPALIRDFSPQVGRATAMGFWTSGPVLGSLIVFVVASATVPTVVTDPRFWTKEYLYCGIAGLVVFAIALLLLRELSPQLRDQLMVTMHDRALIEAVRKGRQAEFAAFQWQGKIPDPQDESTFLRSHLHWELREEAPHRSLLEFHKELIRLRKALAPLAHLSNRRLEVTSFEEKKVLAVRRWFEQEETVQITNFSSSRAEVSLALPAGRWRKVLDSLDARWDGKEGPAPEGLESPGECALSLPAHACWLFAKPGAGNS